MKIPKKKLCKCGRYYHPIKYEMCWECYSERPLSVDSRGYDEARHDPDELTGEELQEKADEMRKGLKEDGILV